MPHARSKWIQGWKIVGQEDRKSAVTFIKKPRLYPVGLDVKRPAGYGPLAVFTNLNDANSFCELLNRWNERVGHSRRCMVVECVYESSKDKNLWERMGINDFWKKSVWHSSLLPNGTDLADVVCCIE